MIRWSARLRRAATLLLGVHLLQVILLAASAVCDPASAAVSQTAAQAIPVASAHAHHAHGALDVTAGLTDRDASSHHSAPAHHAPQGASCPMAMACTVTAVMAPVPTIVTSEVRVPTLLVPHTATAPMSMRGAPEPPPPRA